MLKARGSNLEERRKRKCRRLEEKKTYEEEQTLMRKRQGRWEDKRKLGRDRGGRKAGDKDRRQE